MGTEQGENWGFEATEDAFDKPKLWMKRKKSGYLKYIRVTIKVDLGQSII